jgi:hypothetical protein
LEYPQLAKRLEMLEFLHRAFDESQDRGDRGVVLEFYNPPPHESSESYNTLPSYDEPPGLTVFGMRVDIAQELGISGAEAIGLLRDLETEGCVYLDYVNSGPYVDAGEVTVGLTEKGRAAVGALPEPNGTLLEKLDAVAEAIGDLQGVRSDEKKPAIEAVEELKHFVRALPSESAVELLGRLPGVLGLGAGRPVSKNP